MSTRKTAATKTATTKKATKKTAPKRASSSTATKKRATKKKAPAKKKAAAKQAGDEEVTVDRRRAERRDETAEPKLERRQKVNRRRQIDPTTCERDYSDQEVEFMNALDDYKRKSGRMFPTCSEVLEVIRDLGYVQLSSAELATRTAAGEAEEASELAECEADAEADVEAELIAS